MKVPEVTGISKFPEVQRDLALVVDQSIQVQSLLDAVHSIPSEWLQGVEVFDIYQGQGIEPDQKSIALTLRIQHSERTLLDQEVEDLVAQIVSALENRVNAKLR
jgi:phenylalanyl-tRNA synthetase beta chain